VERAIHRDNINFENENERRLQEERVLKENTRLCKFSAYSPVLSNEQLIDKKGILGRVKLGIKSLGDKTLHNIESVYLKYTDISKRKFV
jgi:hypothetical protein